MKLKVGDVVTSKAGRDQSRRYVVYKVLENFVLLVDGEIRKLENPKKKNIRHCKLTGEYLEVIGGKFENDKEVFDSEIRKALRLSETVDKAVNG